MYLERKKSMVNAHTNIWNWLKAIQLYDYTLNIKKNIAVLADLSHHTSMFMFISEMVTQDHCKTTAQIRVSSYVSTQRFFFQI